MSLAKSSIGITTKVETSAVVARLEACLADLDRLGENLAAAHLSACIDALRTAPSDAIAADPGTSDGKADVNDGK